jgi:hypothetical protein
MRRDEITRRLLSTSCARKNGVLREQLGGRRLRFTDDQRRRLAVKGQVSGSPGTAASSGA